MKALYCTWEMKQVDITISKNRVLQILGIRTLLIYLLYKLYHYYSFKQKHT